MTDREKKLSAMTREFLKGIADHTTLASSRQHAGTFAANLVRVLDAR